MSQLEFIFISGFRNDIDNHDDDKGDRDDHGDDDDTDKVLVDGNPPYCPPDRQALSWQVRWTGGQRWDQRVLMITTVKIFYLEYSLVHCIFSFGSF